MAGRCGHPARRLRRQPRPPRASRSSGSTPPRSCAAGRSGTSTDDVHRLCARRRAGSPTRTAATRAHRRLARRRAARRCSIGRPVTAIRDAGGGDVRGRRPADGTYTAGRGRARRRRLDERAAGLVRPAAAAHDHQGAGHLLRLPGPGGLRARPVPGLDLDGRSVVLRLPDLRRGRARRSPRTAAARRRRRDPRPSSGTRPRSRASTDVPRDATCPGALGPPIYTKTCLYTLTPGPRLRRRSPARRAGRRWSPSAPATGSSTPRSSGGSLAELALDGATPSAGELGAFRIDRPILLETDPPTHWMV